MIPDPRDRGSVTSLSSDFSLITEEPGGASSLTNDNQDLFSSQPQPSSWSVSHQNSFFFSCYFSREVGSTTVLFKVESPNEHPGLSCNISSNNLSNKKFYTTFFSCHSLKMTLFNSLMSFLMFFFFPALQEKGHHLVSPDGCVEQTEPSGGAPLPSVQ